MDTSKRMTKGASKSVAWFVYILIIFEMLYMSTPFAVFFYSVYGAPLKYLNKTPSTSWLVHNIFPHFTQTDSILINTLLYISWPLMGIGLLLFIVAFVQIYWAKFRKKTAVVGGLYRFIRHPQYVALSIFGLGITLFWSRMIVILMYVTMLFVYYLLADNEERECAEKYGESYSTYVQKTGRFLPKFTREKPRDSKDMLPQTGLKRIAGIIAIYLLTVSLTVGVGLRVRSYSLSKISTVSWKDAAAISTSLMSEAQMQAILSIAKHDRNAARALERVFDSSGRKQLIYIVPLEWKISELAMEPEEARGYHGFHPTSHGNSTTFDRNLYKILFSKAIVDDDAEGKKIISRARGQKPLLLVKVDLVNKRVTGMERPPERGKYGDIPVPLF